MKKLFYLFSATLLAFGSCTNDYDASCLRSNDVNPIKNDTISPPKPDSIPVNVGPILLKKLVHSYLNSQVSTIELLYDGTKIVSDRDSNNLTLYTYTGDVITKIEKVNTSGQVYITKEYVYANGKVDYILSNEFETYYKTTFVYNLDGSVFYDRIVSDSLGNHVADTPISGRYVFSEGNLIQHQYYNGSSEALSTYEYDLKNNPRLNILGVDLLLDMNEVFAVNNIIKKVDKITNTNNDEVIIETTTYSHDYDANGYPVKTTQTFQKGDVINTEISVLSY